MDPRQKAFSLLEEFKAFALKGNVVDLAIGVIIGGAFAKIVNSLVTDVIMPAISIVMPTDDAYQHWKLTIGNKEILYGQFIGEVVNFLIMAIILYVFIVKFLGFIMRTKKEEGPPVLTKEQELLTEIRDLLKGQAVKGSGPAPDHA